MFWKRARALLLDILLIMGGDILMAVAVDVFLDPNDVVPGGFTAIAMFANRAWSWPIGLTLLVLNLPFLIIGMIVLGAEFGPKTVFAAVFASIAIDSLAPMLPVVQGDPLLYTVFSGVLYGVGQGLVFRANATSGGSETPAKLLNHFYGVRMSKTLFVIDLVILAAAAALFGLEQALYALIVAWVTQRALNFMELGDEASQSVYIITANPSPIQAAIVDKIKCGVTLLAVEGDAADVERTMLFTVVNRREVSRLRKAVSQIDSGAYIVVTHSSEVLGKGFRPLTHRPRKVKASDGTGARVH